MFEVARGSHIFLQHGEYYFMLFGCWYSKFHDDDVSLLETYYFLDNLFLTLFINENTIKIFFNVCGKRRGIIYLCLTLLQFRMALSSAVIIYKN